MGPKALMEILARTGWGTPPWSPCREGMSRLGADVMEKGYIVEPEREFLYAGPLSSLI